MGVNMHNADAARQSLQLVAAELRELAGSGGMRDMPQLQRDALEGVLICLALCWAEQRDVLPEADQREIDLRFIEVGDLYDDAKQRAVIH
jgi:hypothetical protein